MTKQRYGSMFHAYLGLVVAFLLYVGIGDVRQQDRWAMGDWITNYAGGFVRRGLTGQAAFFLGHHVPLVSLYLWTFLLQLICYGVLFGTIVHLLRGLTWRLWMIATVYSPATVSFTVFDPTFAFRKEILFLALLGAIILALEFGSTHLSAISLLLALGMIALVLSHEGMLFYYPYIVCAFLIGLSDVRRALIACAPGAVAGLFAFAAVFRHPGSLGTATSICSSLGGHDLTYEPCSGAILYMTKSADSAHRDVISAISYWHLKLVMPFLLVMAIGPFVLGMVALWKAGRQRFAWWSLLACSVVSWLATLVLFFYAFDWNRWIYIHIFSSLMLMLMIERRSQRLAPAPQRPVLPAGRIPKLATVALLVVSMAGWQLSFYHHFPLPGENLGLYLRKRLGGPFVHNRPETHPQAASPGNP